MESLTMSKRNFTLLIIILLIIVVAVFWFLYFKGYITNIPKYDNPGTNFISQFNPFGESKPNPPPVPPPFDISEDEPSVTTETLEAKLVRVSSMPIAGFTVFNKERLKDVPIVAPETGPLIENTLEPEKETKNKKASVKPAPPETEFAPALRYVDRATGNIFQTFVDKIEERKFSVTIIPRVYEAYFGNKGESVIMRYLKADEETIETFVGNLPKELLGGDTTGNNEAKGSFLPNNVRDISMSPDGLKIFYLFESNSDSGSNMIGITMNLLNNKKIQVFDSPFTEWLSFWPNNNLITLTTKPSANIPGYMYTINSLGKNFSKILGDINGLTTLGSPDGKLILYGNNNLSLYIYDINSRSFNLLGVRTLPEKCVWGKANDVIYCAVPKFVSPGEYPDSWYQGEVSFSDQLWKIDVKTGNATIILDPFAIVFEEIDGIKMALSEAEDYLFFVNKKDSFLWKLELK
ncbi:hypothetical protein A2641_01425 [Candidatus Nomurabacteria bacterium RIFCSPHIGHO2_01_FULL_37_25]|uniref:Uncharacterized protein n=1 Tax=Candidatus Nomurabacteria bacterium RIFCSPLOWO2_01_FULL_36_16 TaxID=1801767 RepID=A0A1F6WYZ8_9BACT|nr:MAG: hypothetical protein A2641_01425 [Candidatus Nomurabacteria bacterium RIFCSPHIGHO2_01_FULL_37_25]OGI75372.1 MAG: hypothetical protein A3D36_02325 [Candidatus Nomurabacteria bacterium RIFCSPHIGHO2_02_FULL_36_29]OGI87119.1 MAG: hypothetical protein A3A91_00420 [Candidatus Nomurabacteria bacterium RIFCSPLOWO2_01_FULL_36_16]